MDSQIVLIKKETTDITTRATEMVISDQPQYKDAADFLLGVKSLQKKIKETFDPIVDAAHRAHKEATTKRKEHLEPVLMAEGLIKGKMVTYTSEQERLRKEREDKLRRQAEAEEARKRKALEEQARRQEEKAAELRRRAEEADFKERQKLEEAAKRAEEKAEQRREKAEDVRVEAPVLASTVETPKGISYKDRWYAIVLDKTKIPIEYLVPDMLMLNRHAQNTKGKVPISGVDFVFEKIVAGRI